MISNQGRRCYLNIGGKGKGSYSLIQPGKNLLIVENIASQPSSSNMPKPRDPLYSAFQLFLKQQKDNNPSFSKIVSEEDNDDSSKYILTPHNDLTILLEEKDIMLYFEENDDPWNLFSRYLDIASYAACSYKLRNYYENKTNFYSQLRKKKWQLSNHHTCTVLAFYHFFSTALTPPPFTSPLSSYLNLLLISSGKLPCLLQFPALLFLAPLPISSPLFGITRSTPGKSLFILCKRRHHHLASLL
ncbi:unnamed protein product [Lactuca saligna]|uniref:Uncharacterized protein n=1 Tax=Lactuca saligna TaxID=75948 RepID=A0AA35ZVY7_LACSI|nr:unnamed protein product [Lactuca saligna]